MDKASKGPWIKRNFLGIFLFFTILFFGVQWFFLNRNINSLKKINEDYVGKFETAKTNLIDLEKVANDSLSYKFSKEDVAEINRSLSILAKEIYSERNKAESIIDKDIDRLNLYLALGVGFLALLGVFVPFLVNILSNDDLKTRQKFLRDKLESLESKSIIIDELKDKTDGILPRLSIISLQIAIHRLFNVSSMVLTETREESSEQFSELFVNIKDQLGVCSNDKNLLTNDGLIFKQTIIDFTKLLDNDGFKFTSYVFSRGVESKLNGLIVSLKELSENLDKNEPNYFKKAIDSLDGLIIEIHKEA